ncbi:hypothetical protein CC86DRAFT_386175 [Ophiobolus disseminans]|uniref:Uncharacterized protein n=1 Tax=Ophiobolus disseminans TaxID=1469910 RepID=A0A6A6ZM05_9PLEO|nr:hypothetical protein CC86DRAFT_386175 [Ophiobolus disseminans]
MPHSGVSFTPDELVTVCMQYVSNPNVFEAAELLISLQGLAEELQLNGIDPWSYMGTLVSAEVHDSNVLKSVFYPTYNIWEEHNDKEFDEAWGHDQSVLQVDDAWGIFPDVEIPRSTDRSAEEFYYESGVEFFRLVAVAHFQLMEGIDGQALDCVIERLPELQTDHTNVSDYLYFWRSVTPPPPGSFF